MVSARQHIISKCRWDTLFDAQEEGADLQRRLSSWSRLKMPSEIDAIFNEICPPGQLWKIESLTIDLGPVNFDELDAGLSLGLREQLGKSLAHLLLKVGDGDGAVEILNEDALQMELLACFFQSGFISGKYPYADDPINPILAEQLKKDRQKVIALLREIGARDGKVRRRIAFQVSEANIIAIIEGLEPNNAQQVIDFSAELASIQAKKPIAQTGLSDFRKNIWFWILNYLMAERGSVFNKIAFIKSNLLQMATHYSIAYEALIMMIQQAIQKVAAYTVITEDVLLILNDLTSESREDDIRGEERYEEKRIVKALADYFSDPISRDEAYSVTELNDMILSAVRAESPAFRQQLLSFHGGEKLLSERLSSLNEGSLEALFALLTADNPAVNENDLHYLVSLCKEIDVDEKFVWEAAVGLLVTAKGISWTKKSFLDRIVAAVAEKERCDKLSVLERLLCAVVPTHYKTLSSLAVHADLMRAFAAEIAGPGGAVTSKRLTVFLDRMGQLLRTDDVDHAHIVALLKPLAEYIRLNPSAAFRTLKSYRYKKRLQNILPYVLDEHLTNLLLMQHEDRKTPAGFISLITILQKAHLSFGIPERMLPEVALEAILSGSMADVKAELQQLLEEVAFSVPFAQRGKFFQIVEKWCSGNEAGKTITMEFISGMKRRLTSQNRWLLREVNDLIRKGHDPRPIGRLLYSNFKNKEFERLRRKDDQESAAVLNGLMKNATALKEDLVGKYSRLLKDRPFRLTVDQAKKLLNELFWQCLVSYSFHWGNSSAVRKLFKAAFFARFNSSLEPGDKTRNWAVATGPLKNRKEGEPGNLLPLIEQAIVTAHDSATSDGQIIPLNKMIVAGLESYPGEMIRIIKKITISEQRIQVLSDAVPFNQFCLLLAGGATGSLNDALTSFYMLYELADRITSGHLSQRLLFAYWRGIWTVLRTNQPDQASLCNLVAESMYQLSVEKQIDSGFVLSEIGKLPWKLTRTLRAAFARYNTVFTTLPVNDTTKLAGKMHQIKRTGLLYSFIRDMVVHRAVPLWLFYADARKTAQLLNQIAALEAVTLLIVLKKELIPERQMLWLHDTVDFPLLINSVAGLNPNGQGVLKDLAQFYKAIGKMNIAGVSSNEIRFVLFKKLVQAWTSNNWHAISAEQLWSELTWYLCLKRGVAKKQFIRAAKKVTWQLPISLQLGFRKLKSQEKRPAVILPVSDQPVRPVLRTALPINMAQDGVFVKNAGLVLVNNYVTVLFERLGLLADKKFIHSEAPEKAVHYLQYVVTGLTETEEYLLPLNKVMCGLPLAHPVDRQIQMNENQQNVIDGLIKAMIAHWPSAGDHSLYGFRGNWLVRDGLLKEFEDKWELKVEKRAYDVLLNRSPFSFSIIKYPWMVKPLHVAWSY